MTTKPATSVKEFYDEYSSSQQKTGINKRHRSILSKLRKAGLKPDSSVLEIGCGIGTLSELLAGYLKNGQLLCVDISPKSIEIARQRMKRFSHVDFKVSDMSDFSTDMRFDCVLFPDVLEHIPVEQHAHIFNVCSKLLRPNGFMFIHIPDPIYLDYVRAHKPELLQIIDQSVYATDMAHSMTDTSLFIDKFERYSLFANVPDYNVYVIRGKASLEANQVALMNNVKSKLEDIRFSLSNSL